MASATTIWPIPEDLLALPLPRDYARWAPKLQCSNVTCTYRLAPEGDRRINAADLSRRLPGVSYDATKFAACTVRSGRATTLIFDGGSAVCIGCAGVAEARIAAIAFTSFLSRCGELVSYQGFTVENIVCRANAGFFIDLAAIRAAYPVESSYESGKFPGLFFHLKKPGVRISTFVSGCCFVTGSRDFAVSELCWSWYWNAVLKNFRLDRSSRPNSSEYRMHTLHTMGPAAADDENCERIWLAHMAAITAGNTAAV